MNLSSTGRDTLLVYTDDTVLGCGVESILSEVQRFVVKLAPYDISQLLPAVSALQPHVLLLDLIPGVTLGLIGQLRRVAPATRFILWGRCFSDELICHAREIGVSGFLQRGIPREKFVRDLVTMARGETPVEPTLPATATKIELTRRESQLVELLVQGLRNKEIAACLGISTGTVRIYLSKLFVKTGARDRFEVAVFGLKNAYCGEAAWDGQNGFVTECDEARARPAMRSLVLVEPRRKRGYPPLAKASGE
jgi:DNA-binding NarL/FixJ family response regulator